MHAASRSPVTSPVTNRSGGTARAQSSTASGQRVRNAHPDGTACSDGGVPGIAGRSRPFSSADGVDPSAMRRYLVSLDLPPPADTVVVGLDLHLTYPKIAEAQRAILAGAEFVCSNRDRAYPVEGRLLPGAGTIVAAIEVATGAKALCIGKPEPFLFQEAIRRAGADGRDRVVVVGDSTDYDIVAAHRVGATGVLITTGLTERDTLASASGDAAPDRVIHSLEELFGLPEFAGT